MEELIKEAYAITGDQDDLGTQESDEKEQAKWIFGTRWSPSGTLKIWDDSAFATTTTTKFFSHWEFYDCGSELPIAPESTQFRIAIEQCKRAVYKYISKPTQGRYVSLVGTQVLINQWFTVRQRITDHNGYFKTSSVRGKVRYIIQWERHHYSIRNGSLFQAETRGPNVTKQNWNLNIKGGDDEYHAMIHTAAHSYYYGSRFGLTSPPTNAT